MKKLKPEQLFPYGPYSIKVIMEGKKTNVAWMSTKNIAVIRPNGIGEYKRIKWKYAHLNIKPILRPLSDLDGQYEYRELNSKYDYPNFGHFERSVLSGHASYELICELASEHFDVFGLIEKGLAIDIKTLK